MVASCRWLKHAGISTLGKAGASHAFDAILSCCVCDQTSTTSTPPPLSGARPLERAEQFHVQQSLAGNRQARRRHAQYAINPNVKEVPAQQPSADSSLAANNRVRKGADAKSGSWNVQDARGGPEGEDYLYELGRSDVSMNVDTGAISPRTPSSPHE